MRMHWTRSRSKVYGDIYGTYWFPEGRRVMPYRVYVPYAYDSSKPQKALVTFPGGLANENSYFDRVPGGGFQREAEVHDYLVIGLTGYGVSTFFGSRIPILQTLVESIMNMQIRKIRRTGRRKRWI